MGRVLKSVSISNCADEIFTVYRANPNFGRIEKHLAALVASAHVEIIISAHDQDEVAQIKLRSLERWTNHEMNGLGEQIARKVLGGFHR